MIRTITYVLRSLRRFFTNTSSVTLEPHGLVETRTRVSFFLPVAKSRETKAAWDVIDYLETQHEKGTVTGFSHSNIVEPVFLGVWWNKAWQRERVSLFIIDYKYDLEEMDRILKDLKENVAKIYKENGSAQDEIWIIAQRATRYV